MKHTWGLSLALLWSISVSAALKVKHIEVKGYEVHLVDVGRGNEFGFVFGVPFGGADDPPHLFGRAHLFEHMFLRGSNRHPGVTAIDDAMSKFGYRYNAYTGLAETIYHGTGTDEHALDAMPVMMGSLDRPELLPVPYAKEHATVVEEIVKNAPNKPSSAFHNLPFVLLSKDGHLSRGRHYGDAVTLGAMTAEDLRALHEDVYHASNVTIALVGNFTSGRLSEDDVLRKLNEILPTREAKPAYVPAARPPAFAEEKILEVVEPNENLGRIAFPIDADADPRHVRAFMSVFDHDHSGGTLHQGRDLGWITSLGAWTQRVGSENFVFLDFRLTEEGYRRRRDVANWILASVDAARTELFPEELVNQVRRSAASYYDNLERDPSRIISSYGHWIASDFYKDFLDGDWQRAMSILTPEAVRQGARALRDKNKMLAFLGPNTEGNTEYDHYSRLAYGVKHWDDQTTETPAALPPHSHIAPVELPAVPRGELLPAEDTFEDTGTEAVIRTSRPEWSERTVVARLDLPQISTDERANLKAWVYAVEEELRAEGATLQSEGLSLDLTVGTNTIDFFAASNSGREFAAIEWLLDRIAEHRSDPKLIDRYRRIRKRTLAKYEEGYAGSVAARISHGLIVPYQSEGLSASVALDHVTPARIRQTLARVVSPSRKTLVVAGPVSQEEIDHLLARLRAFSPESVPFVKPIGLTAGVNTEYREPWRSEAQSGIGIARLYAGADDTDVEGSLAAQLITRVMHESVFPLARPYGYVQSVGTTSIDGSRYGIFTGQAAEEEHVTAITTIWDDELKRWARREVSSEEIENARQGVLVSLGVPHSSSRDAAYVALDYLRGRGTPFFRPRAQEILGRLSHEEIFAAADRYLAPTSKSFTVVKGVGEPQSCQAMLEAREAVKGALVGR